jgi:photosystem II stability/assembly factor-like uncharacterized protein
MKAFYLVFVLLISFSFKGALSAENSRYNTSSLAIDALWANGNNAFVDVNSTLYKTTDGGKTWTKLAQNAGLREEINVDAISVDDNVVMIGTNNDERLYRSENFGVSFISIPEGAPRINGVPAAVPKIIENVKGQFFVGGTNMGILKYSPSEKKWLETGLTGIAYAISHLGGDTIWTHTGGATGGPLKYSHDGGLNWIESISRPQLYITPTFPWPLSPTDFIKIGNRIVTTNSESGGSGVAFTDDNGATWTIGNTLSIAKDLIKIGSTLYALDFFGLFESTDSAKTWVRIPDIMGNTMMVWKENKILLGTQEGLIEYNPGNKTKTAIEIKTDQATGIDQFVDAPQLIIDWETNSLQVRNIKEQTKILMYSSTGSIVPIKRNNATVNIAHLRPGIYFVVAGNNEFKPMKFLKK